METKILYGVLVVLVTVLAWSAYTVWAAPASANGISSVGAGTPSQPPTACGDVNDLKNIQHLSHHPDQYQECYPYIDPQKFKQAVGTDISEYLR